MTDAILVLNAGSSSLKFSAFAAGNGAGELLARGQVSGLGVAPRFVFRGPADDVVEEGAPPGGADLDHEQSLGFVLDRCRERLGDHRLAAVGHRPDQSRGERRGSPGSPDE